MVTYGIKNQKNVDYFRVNAFNMALNSNVKIKSSGNDTYQITFKNNPKVLFYEIFDDENKFGKKLVFDTNKELFTKIFQFQKKQYDFLPTCTMNFENNFYFFTLKTVFMRNKEMIWNISFSDIYKNYSSKRNIKCGFLKRCFFNIDSSNFSTTTVYSGTINGSSAQYANDDSWQFNNNNSSDLSDSTNIGTQIGNALANGNPIVQIVNVIGNIVGDIKDPQRVANTIKKGIKCYFNGCGSKSSIRSQEHYSGTKKI